MEDSTKRVSTVARLITVLVAGGQNKWWARRVVYTIVVYYLAGNATWVEHKTSTEELAEVAELSSLLDHTAWSTL